MQMHKRRNNHVLESRSHFTPGIVTGLTVATYRRSISQNGRGKYYTGIRQLSDATIRFVNHESKSCICMMCFYGQFQRKTPYS